MGRGSYVVRVFQPTLPVRGATYSTRSTLYVQLSFQPTLPVRGATALAWLDTNMPRISTHAPRAGSDS